MGTGEVKEKGEAVDGLDELMGRLEKEGLTRNSEPNGGNGFKHSMDVLKRYEKNRASSYGTIEDLQETAAELMLINKKLEEKERIEQSSVLRALANTKTNFMRYLGQSPKEITQQDLLEEKMRLAEKFNQQLVETKNEVSATWNQVIGSIDAARQGLVAAINTHKATEEKMSNDTDLYERASQQLEQMQKAEPHYLAVIKAKDTLRRRIEAASATQMKAYSTIVAKDKEIDMLTSHEKVMMGLTTRLDCAANEAKENIKLAYTTHTIAQFYRDGRKRMQLFDSLQGIALKFIDIEKEAKELSSIVDKTASKNERTTSTFGRISSRLGEYSSAFKDIEESQLKSVEQRARDIMDSYGE